MRKIINIINIDFKKIDLYKLVTYIFLREELDLVFNQKGDYEFNIDVNNNIKDYIDFIDNIRIKENILYYTAVSSCLCGFNTKYNGYNNYNSIIRYIYDKKILIPICPEVSGKLTTPRDPSEQVNDLVLSNKGKDVTKNFIDGANIALRNIKRHNIDFAILKEGSPSCGVSMIYDGTFSGTKISGKGVAAKLFVDNNIKIISEKIFKEEE
jgi:uncharacterized protein YbbK (DUF523 family)